MPDDRSSGAFGGNGYIMFSGSAGRIPDIPDKKRSKDQQPTEEEEKKEDKDEFKKSEYVDRSAQLSATLNSLALLNVADVLKNKSNKVNTSQNKTSEPEKNQKTETNQT